VAFCENCGNELEEGTAFCDNCGAKVAVTIKAKGKVSYCEQCGAPYAEGTAFCESCGASLGSGSSEKMFSSSSRSFSSINIFNNLQWKSEWYEAASGTMNQGKELGIILTRVNELVSQLGCNEKDLTDRILDYVDAASERGVNYYLLDSKSGEIEDILAKLKETVDVARPKYLLIMGNEEIIPVAVWDNQAGDSDEQVFSDIPYALLDGTSPWEGQNFNLSEAIRVGRVPSYDDEGLSKYWSYFENAKVSTGTLDKLIPYGLSALVWEDESNYIYSGINNKDVDTCPDCGVETASSRIPKNTNLFYFNLHGGDTTKFWVGQNEVSYPKAFAPEIFYGYPTPFILGVEACYGARYMDGLTEEDSTLFSAMQNKCLAFLGSTTIAYGTCAPTGSCADVLVGNYLDNIKKGETAGDSHIAGLKALVSKGNLSDADVKTFAQFALYGDPSVATGKNKNTGKMKNLMKGIIGAPKGIKVNLPDISKAVHMVEAKISADINKSIDDYVAKSFMPEINAKGIDMDAIFQQTSQLTNTGLYVKTYSKDAGDFKNIVKVYFTEKGKIQQTLLSK